MRLWILVLLLCCPGTNHVGAAHACSVAAAGICPCLQQMPHHRLVPLPYCQVQRCAALPVLRIDASACPLPQQQLDQPAVPAGAGQHEGGVAAIAIARL